MPTGNKITEYCEEFWRARYGKIGSDISEPVKDAIKNAYMVGFGSAIQIVAVLSETDISESKKGEIIDEFIKQAGEAVDLGLNIKIHAPNSQGGRG